MANSLIQHFSTVGFLRSRRWRLVGGLLILGSLGLLLSLALPSSVIMPLIDLEVLPRGDWPSDDPIYAFHDELNQISISQRDDTLVLAVTSDNQDSDLYTGFGVVGDFDVPNEAALTLVWRGRVTGPRLSLHLIDASPGRTRPDGGEVFTALLPPVTEDWTMVRLLLADFGKDPEQPDDVPADGILDTQGISNVEIGLAEGTFAELEIREIAFSWKAAREPTYLVMLIGFASGLLILARTPRQRSFVRPLDSPTETDTSTNVFSVLCLILAIWVLAAPHFNLSRTEAIAFGALFVLSLVDEFVGPRPRSSRLWNLRYVVLVSCVLWLSTTLAPLLSGALLLLALSATMVAGGRQLVPVAILLPLLGVLLQPPIMDLTSKGPLLLHVLVAAVTAMGLTEIVRGSEVSKHHQRTAMMYRGILEQIDDGIVLIEPTGRIELTNHGFERLLDVEPGGLQGRRITEFLAAADGQPISVSALVPGGEKAEVMLVSPETGRQRVALVAAHVIHQGQIPDRLQLIATDISDRKRMEAELERANERLQLLSATDALTGLDNRRAFEEALESEWNRCARTGLPLTLMYCDIDAFKAYNDSHGHQAGDRVLKQVADVLASQIKRPGDRLARYGGEEFVALLPDTGIFHIENFAESVRLAVEALGIAHSGNPAAPVVTISIGVAACTPKQEEDPDHLLHAADMALYAAKSAGRNRVVLHATPVSKSPTSP